MLVSNGCSTQNENSLKLALNSDQENNNDRGSNEPNEMKTNPEDKLLISDKGVTIMKCYQCCEEVELTDQILDRISGGMFSKMNKQASLNYRFKSVVYYSLISDECIFNKITKKTFTHSTCREYSKSTQI